MFAIKLSIWTLCDWLCSRQVETMPLVTEGYAQIQRLRLSDIRSYSPECVEILPAASVSGGEGYDTALVNNMDVVFVKNVETAELVNMLSDAFAFYTQWEQKLYAASMAGAGLQELLDIAHTAFARPMIIKNDGSWIYAITKGYPSDIHPYWAQMEADAGRQVEDYDSVQAVSTDPGFQVIFSEKYPSVRQSPSYGGMILHANLFSRERRVGEIIVLENGHGFNRGDVHLMHSFADIVEKYINNNYEYYISAADPYAVLKGLIEKRSDVGDNMPAIYEALDIRSTDELCAAVIEVRDHSDTPVLGVLREKLTKQLSGAKVFSLGNRIVCLLPSEGSRGSEKAAKVLAQYIPSDLFACGISYEFCGLEDLEVRYRQACAALEQAAARGKTVMTLYEAAYECICLTCRKLPELQIFLHPDVERLRRTDETMHTQYGHTLFYYLICGGNYTDAANFMGIHRNSLIYRMDKIRYIMRTNPDDLDNRRLLLCTFLAVGIS